MRARYDAVIAGGGLSGLSLAARLAQARPDARVLLVDDEAAGPATQSWAYWSTTPPPAATPPSAVSDLATAPDPAVSDLAWPDVVASASFDRIRVHAGGETRTLPLGRYRYRLVRRRDLRRAVLDRLVPHPGFEIHTGRVDLVRDAGTHAETIVDGHPVRSEWVFDSVSRRRRNPAGGTGANADHIDARLAFTGWEVRCPHPAFDPDTPTLFDFRTPQRGGSRFVYVLPTDPHRALVELTSFVPRHAVPPDPADRDEALAAYLRATGRAEYEILRTEAAVLSLRAFPPPRRHGRVLAIGAAGGLIKASTGYAFQRVQRDSAAIARSLARYGHPFAPPATPGRALAGPVRRALAGRYHLLDAVLLELLDRSPARLESTFARLFATNPVERVLAFLDETSTPAQDLALISSLPPVPYLRAAASRAARGWKEAPTPRWAAGSADRPGGGPGQPAE